MFSWCLIPKIRGILKGLFIYNINKKYTDFDCKKFHYFIVIIINDNKQLWVKHKIEIL